MDKRFRHLAQTGRLLLTLLATAACAPAPRMLVARTPELPAGSTIRVRPDTAAPAKAWRAAAAALRDAGFQLDTARGAPTSHTLLVRARCDDPWYRGPRCREFMMRVVMLETLQVAASAAIVPAPRKPPSLAAIADTVRARLGGP